MRWLAPGPVGSFILGFVVLVIVGLVVVGMLAGCANPPTARTFGSMMGAQPSCIVACIIRQDIVTDSSTPPTDASTSLSTLEGPAVFNK